MSHSLATVFYYRDSCAFVLKEMVYIAFNYDFFDGFQCLHVNGESSSHMTSLLLSYRGFCAGTNSIYIIDASLPFPCY